MKSIKELEKDIEIRSFSHIISVKNPIKSLKIKVETLKEVSDLIDAVLTNARIKANEQIKDEQSMAHTHTAINQIDDELKLRIQGK